jgi:hypothetical protein
MEPPIQTEYLRSGGAMILTFMDEGARAVISFCMRSEIPGYMVVPPDYEELGSVKISEDCVAYHDNVAVQVFPDVDIALHDGVESGDVDTTALKTKNGRLEESLRSTEALVANGDDLTIGKLVGLLQAGALAGRLDLLLEVEGDVAELLLDVTDDFALGGGREGVTTLSQNLHEVVSQIATSHVNTGDGVGKSETLVDGDNVSDTVTGVEHDTGGTTGSVQGQDSLDGDVKRGCVEGLEDDLGHLLTVGLGVDGSLGEQDGVLLGGNTQLVVEGVVPNLLHVVPVGHDTVLDGVSQSQDTTLRLCLVTNVGVLLTHTNHDTASLSARESRRSVSWIVVPVMARSADNGGCDIVRKVISRGLAAAEEGIECSFSPRAGGGKTYGRLHGAHRHRRNRPCTYPN